MLGPDDTVIPDLGGRLPGNEVWIRCDRKAVQSALEQRLFTSVLGSEAVSSLDIVSQIEGLMRQAALGMLSISNKAGCVTTGFVKVEAAIRNGEIAILLHASESAVDGKGKLNRLAERRMGREFLSSSVYCDFSSSEIDKALGGNNVRHAAVLKGGPAGNLDILLDRLRTFSADHSII